MFAKFSTLSIWGVAFRQRCTPISATTDIPLGARKTTLLQMLRDGRLSVNAPTLYPSNEVPEWALLAWNEQCQKPSLTIYFLEIRIDLAYNDSLLLYFHWIRAYNRLKLVTVEDDRRLGILTIHYGDPNWTSHCRWDFPILERFHRYHRFPHRFPIASPFFPWISP